MSVVLKIHLNTVDNTAAIVRGETGYLCSALKGIDLNRRCTEMLLYSRSSYDVNNLAITAAIGRSYNVDCPLLTKTQPLLDSKCTHGVKS